MALFCGKLKTPVAHGYGVRRWYCLLWGDGTEGDNTMAVSSEEEHVSADYVLQMVSAWCWVVPPPYLCSGNANF